MNHWTTEESKGALTAGVALRRNIETTMTSTFGAPLLLRASLALVSSFISRLKYGHARQADKGG